VDGVPHLQQVYLRLCRVAAPTLVASYSFLNSSLHGRFSKISDQYLKPPMKPPDNKINRTTIGVVGGVIDELIIEADRGADGVTAIGFDELLRFRSVRKLCRSTI